MSGLLDAGKRLYYPPYLRNVKSKNFGKKNKTLLSNPAQPSPPKNCVWEAAGNAGTKMAVKFDVGRVLSFLTDLQRKEPDT